MPAAMMVESPPTLEELCCNFIASNILALSSDDSGTVSESAAYASDVLQQCFTCHDATTTVFINSNVADVLLSRMSDHGTLCDRTLRLFNRCITCLRHLCIRPASLSAAALRMLRMHPLATARFNTGAGDRRKYVVNDVLGCFGDWSVANLRSLGVAGGSFADGAGPAVVVSLSKLRALRSLDVSRTDFTTHMLDIVMGDLPVLDDLNISATLVTDITPLARCRTRLRRLRAYNLRLGGETPISVLRSLSELRVLDVSDDAASHAFLHSVKLDVNRLLAPGSELKNLASIDISGHEDIDADVLRLFLTSHPLLSFVGLCLIGIQRDEDLFCDIMSEFGHIQFTGLANEELLMKSIGIYLDRPLYMRHCLYVLFTLTQYCSVARPDLIEVVLSVAQRHRRDVTVLTAVTACLYNVVQGDLAKLIHPRQLSEVAQMALESMAASPNQQQLMKNCLLLLCNDHILQDVTFNRYRCSKLVLDSLCQFDDSTMTRMAVAICGILAAKITTQQTSVLGGDRRYMKKLLTIIDAKINARVVDITLKFTLSALWNLSDEAPSTSEAFVAEGGLEIFMRVLETFKSEPDDQRASIEVKLLGFLNNLAEVTSLKPSLICEKILLELRELLKSAHTDVSYFAGGILAHILSDGPDNWPLDKVSRNKILSELEETVTDWQQPEQEMVAYRSFKPFFPLLAEKAEPAVQMWALWAWLHVCSLNCDRYRDLLLKEGGDCILDRLMKSPTSNPRVATLAKDVVCVISSSKSFMGSLSDVGGKGGSCFSSL